MNNPAPSLSDAIQATLRVQLAIDLQRLHARQAQVVRAGQVWEAGQRLRRLTRAALARLQGIVEHVVTPGLDEAQVHARLSEALVEVLGGLSDAAAAESPAGAAPSYAAAFGQAVRPRRTLTVSQWADTHREIKTGTANPGPWHTDLVPYLREIMDSLSVHDPCREVVVMKSAQGGGTEVLLNWIGYVASHAPAEMMMVMPTIELRDRFVKRRLRGLIRETAPVAEALGGLRSRDAEASMGLLRFPGGGLILSGANAANSLRSDAVRYVACDEVDGFEWQVGGEGDPLELIENRQRTYSRRKLLLVSTPTRRDGSRIEQRYQQTDQRRYHLPCPHCGALQVMRWANMHWITRTVAAAPGAAERREVVDAWYECADCGGRIDEHDKPALLPRGQWLATVRDAPRHKRGYHWSSIIAPIGMGPRWTELAQRWLDAQGDPARLQVFINTYLGETWEDPRRHQTEARDIAQRAEPYALRTAPADCLLVTVGVDVQDDRLSVQWLGHGPGRRWWALDWLEPPGNPTHDAVWDDLLELLLQPIPHALGGTLRVRALGVDIGGHHTDQVKAFVTRAAAALKAPAMALQGSRHRAASVLPRRPMHTELTASGKRARRGTPVWQVGTEIAKDRLYNDLSADAELPPDERRGHFAADLPADYYAQLTSESFNPVRNRYELRRGRRNEALDCFCAETDVLTRDGWKRFADVSESDLLATVDLASDAIEYQAPLALISRHYDGEMVQLKGARLDVLVTPNHRMVTFKPRQETVAPGQRRWQFDVPPEITLARDLTVHHAIKLRANWSGDPARTAAVPASVSAQGRQIEPPRVLDAADLAEMVGWWVAEGSLFAGRSRTQGNLRHVVKIAQSKPEPRARLKRLLDRLPWRWREDEAGFRCTSKQLYDYLGPLGRLQPVRRAPQWVKDASPAVIARFVDGAMAGDGWTQRKKPHHRGSRAYATTSPRLADDMQEMFIKLGLAATMRVVTPRPWHIDGRSGDQVLTQYHVYARGVSRAYLDGGGQGKRGFIGRRVPYNGMVYCATVPNGTLIVRRGGKTFIAGNCWVYAYAAAHHPLLRIDKMAERHWQDLAHMLTPPPPGQSTPPAAGAAARPPPAKPAPAAPAKGSAAPRGFASDDWASRL